MITPKRSLRTVGLIVLVAVVSFAHVPTALAKAASTETTSVQTNTSNSSVNTSATQAVSTTNSAPSATPQKSSDLNHDGYVTNADVNLVLSSFGTCQLSASCPADINNDGSVNNADLSIVVKNANSSTAGGNGALTGGGINNTSNTSVSTTDGSTNSSSNGTTHTTSNSTTNTNTNTSGNTSPVSSTQRTGGSTGINPNAFLGNQSQVPAVTRQLIEFVLPIPNYMQNPSTPRVVNEEEEMKARSARSSTAQQNFQTIQDRLEAGTQRIDTLITRIESRMEKMRSDGISIAAAEVFVERAKTSAGVARANTAGLEEAFNNALAQTTDNDARIAFESVRALIASAKSQLEGARRNLLEAVRIMKAAQERFQPQVSAEDSALESELN